METQSEEVQYTQVKTLEVKGKSALVQWFEGDVEHRVYVPEKQVRNGAVRSDVLDKGVLYGIPFEKLLDVKIDSGELVRAIRAMGVWTKDDFNRLYGHVQKRFHSAIDAELKKLIEEVQKYG